MRVPHHILLVVVLLLLLWVEVTLQSLEEAPLVAVYAVRGETAHLPCSLTRPPPEDSVILVLWYRNDTKTPVFSVDSRRFSDPSVREEGSRRPSDVFQGRATFQEDGQGRPDWALVVRDVSFSDQGEYRCRLDFQSSPTHNARVLLHVVEVPRRLEVISGGGAAVEGLVSVQEGRPLTLSCRALGGEPRPNVTWWSGEELIDAEVEERVEIPPTTTTTSSDLDYPSPSFYSSPSSFPSSSNLATPLDTQATNILHLDSVTSAHLSHNLTCLAANTPVLTPLSATLVLLETVEGSVTVELKALPSHLSGGRVYNVTCLASGVWPPPLLSWRLRGKQITKRVHLRHPGGDLTESVLELRAGMGDDGSLLECLGSSPTLPHLTASDSARLTVHYVPQASISIEGGEGSEAGLEAGDSASLTCSARANPPAYNFTFLLNGRPLHRANVVESGQSLTLLEVTHKDAGLYTCVASNSEGDGQSNAVPLHIDFPPVCAWEGVKEVLAVVGEKVRMECKVLASPPDVTFTWEKVTFTANMTQLRSPLQHDDSGLTSTGWATAEGNLSSTQGAMRAECQPRNDLGKADHPCVFAIRIVGDPSPLTGCYHHDVTADSASVTCEDVTSPGYLANTYHIQVREGGLVAATFNNSVPRFNLTSLAPGRDYTLVLHASHAKGRGPDTFLTLRTHTPKAEQVAPERVPVEPVKKPGEDAPQPTDSPRGPGGTPLSVVVSGAVVGVVVGVAVVVAGVVTCRARRGHASSPGKAHHHHHHNVSRDSLLERPSPGVLFQPYGGSSPPSCELLTTFSPGPVVVTQVTSARSSRRSSPLMRKSSTRSAPGGSSPRGIRPRAASCRGGPVHVLEVEADDVTTPRVEVHSPSRLSRLSLRNLRRRGSQPIMTREPQAMLTVESQALGLEVPPAVPAQQPQPAVPAECQQVPDTTQDTAGQTEEQKFESLQPAVSPLNPQTDAPRPQGDTTQPPPPLTGPYVHLTPPPGHASPAPPCQTQPPSPQHSQHHLSPHSAAHPRHPPPPQPLRPQIHTVTLPQPMYPTTLPHMAAIPIVEPPPQTPISPQPPQLRTSALLLRTTPQFTITIPHGTYTLAGDPRMPHHLQEGVVNTQPPPPPRRNTISASTTSLPQCITTLPHLPQNATPTTTVLYANHPAHHHHHHHHSTASLPYTATLPRGGVSADTGGTLSRLASQIHPQIQGESGVPLQVLYLPPESNTSHLPPQDAPRDPHCTSTSPSSTANNVYSTFRYCVSYLSPTCNNSAEVVCLGYFILLPRTGSLIYNSFRCFGAVRYEIVHPPKVQDQRKVQSGGTSRERLPRDAAAGE